MARDGKRAKARPKGMAEDRFTMTAASMHNVRTEPLRKQRQAERQRREKRG